MKSLNAIASSILNNTFSGTYAPQDYPLSITQCKDAVTSLRARMVDELSGTESLSRDGFTQTIEQLSFDKEKKKGQMPALLMAKAFSPVKRICFAGHESNPFYVVIGSKTNAGSPVFLRAGQPVIYIEPSGDFELERCGDISADKLLVEAVFDDPRQIGRFGGTYSDDGFYPMPRKFSDRVEGKLENDYARNYRLMNNPQPAKDQQ